MSEQLRLGVIGLSPGNGHPYSWSAIFNGYDAAVMESCGFPVIPRYLEQQCFPQDLIAQARVTHIWTQEKSLSRHIANAAYIDNVVDNFQDLIGNVDAVLLARDDAENHFEMASPFLKAGLPIYVDKPLAYSVYEAKRLIALQQYPGQLFSCSAMRYAQELKYPDAKNLIGGIRSIHAFIPKDWDKYSVHIIEPALALLPQRGEMKQSSRWQVGDRTSLTVEFSGDVDIQIHTCGIASAPLSLRLIGASGWRDLCFTDTFHAFRSALQDFVDGVICRDVRITQEQMLEVVEMIELGRNTS